LEKEQEKLQKELTKLQGDQPLMKQFVDAEDIAAVVSRWTGIPVPKMLEGEEAKLPQRGGPPPPRAARSPPPHRLVPLPRPHGRRQDRARPRAGRIPVRYRRGRHPARHV